MNNQLIPFAFEGLTLKEACWLEGKPYFTRRAIGEWLEYQNPDRSIHNLTQRHPHINQFSVVTKLVTTDEYPKGHSLTNLMSESIIRNREIEQRVYDPIGLQLIINKSDKPKAIKFQVAAAHLVLAFMQGKLFPSRWCKKGDRLSQIRQLLAAPSGYSRRQVALDIAEREEVSINTVYHWIEQIGERLITKSGKPRRTRSDKSSFKNRPEFAQVIEYLREHHQAQGAEIKKSLNFSVTVSTINRWIRGINSQSAT